MKKLTDNLFVFVFLVFIVFLGSSLITGEEHQVASGEFEQAVHFLDVGQGDATLVEFSETEQLLIDGGPDKSVLNELGRLMPFEDKKIETVVVSHAHADHLSGLIYVLERYEVGQVYLAPVRHNTPDYLTWLQEIKSKKVASHLVEAGDYLEVGGQKSQILWPRLDSLTTDDLNEASLVFSLRVGDKSYLFTGDISAKTLESLDNELQKVDVLKVAHHGSRDGTSRKVLRELQPRWAVISVANKNRFGHPHHTVLNLLESVNVLRTDILGTVSFYSSDKVVTY